MYRSPVKEWQVSWFVFEAIALNGTDTTVKRLDINVKTVSADSSAMLANNGVCAIQSYCPQNKPADLPLFYWRPVHTFDDEFYRQTLGIVMGNICNHCPTHSHSPFR